MTINKENLISIEKDFLLVQNTLQASLEQASTVLAQAAIAAEESEHPKSYEAVAALIKSISEMSDKLLDQHRKKQVLIKEEKEQDKINSSEENTKQIGSSFTGTFSDLQRKMLTQKVIDVEIKQNDEKL